MKQIVGYVYATLLCVVCTSAPLVGQVINESETVTMQLGQRVEFTVERAGRSDYRIYAYIPKEGDQVIGTRYRLPVNGPYWQNGNEDYYRFDPFFGWHDPNGVWKVHSGSDANWSGGTNSEVDDPSVDSRVYPIADGKIVWILKHDGPDAFGNTVIIRHWINNTVFVDTLYAHLDEINSGLDAGDTVTTDTWIGNIGNAGGVYPAHLHWEERTGKGLPWVNGVVGIGNPWFLDHEQPEGDYRKPTSLYTDPVALVLGLGRGVGVPTTQVNSWTRLHVTKQTDLLSEFDAIVHVDTGSVAFGQSPLLDIATAIAEGRISPIILERRYHDDNESGQFDERLYDLRNRTEFNIQRGYEYWIYPYERNMSLLLLRQVNYAEHRLARFENGTFVYRNGWNVRTAGNIDATVVSELPEVGQTVTVAENFQNEAVMDSEGRIWIPISWYRYGALFSGWILDEGVQLRMEQGAPYLAPIENDYSTETPAQTYERVAQEWQDRGFESVTALDVQRYGIGWSDRFVVRDGQLFVLLNGPTTDGEPLMRGLDLWLPGFEPAAQEGPSGPGISYTWQGGNRYDLLPPTGAQIVGTICVPGHSGFDIKDSNAYNPNQNEDGQRGLDLKYLETREQVDTFTVEGWVKMQPLNDILADCVLMQKATMDGSMINGWELSLSGGGRHLQFRCGDRLPTIVVAGKNVYPRGETTHRAMNIITEADIGQWTHLAIVVSLSGKTAQVYKNGVEQTVETPVCDVTTIGPTGGGTTEGQPFVFGSSRFNDGNPREIHGALRDWSVWGYARPIEAMTQTGWVVGLEGYLIAHWRFARSYGYQGIIHDVSQNTNHLRFQWDTGPDPAIITASYTHEEWKGIRSAVFAEGDRLPDVVVAGGDAVDTATLPDPTYHFAMDGTELLGDKLLDTVTNTELRVDGLLSGASGYDSNPAGAYHFNNQNASSQNGQTFLWLQPSDQLQFNHESFAIGVWVRVDPSWKTGTRTPLMIGRHVQLRIDLKDGVPHITNGNLHVAGNSDIADGEWHHLMGVMTYENWENEAARRGTLSLYVDATWIGSDDNPNYGAIIAGSNLELTIGAHPAPRELFQGDIDDVIIWQNTDITREQIVTYYESSGRTAPLVSEDGPVFVATEAGEHSFTIVPQSNATYTDGALVLNKGYARLSGLSLNPGTGPFTIRGVFNTTSGADHALVSMNGSERFLLQVKPDRIVVTLNPPHIYAHIDSGFNFADGEDHSFSMSFDNDRAERILLTVDGVVGEIGDADGGNDTTERYDLSGAYEWLLGAAIGNGVVGGQFTGTIKNIRITTP